MRYYIYIYIYIYKIYTHTLTRAAPNHQEDRAKDLALWGIAAFLGTMFGPCVTGPLLTVFGTHEGVPSPHHPAIYI